MKRKKNYREPKVRNVVHWSKERMHERIMNHWNEYHDQGFASGDAGYNLTPEELYIWHLEQNYVEPNQSEEIELTPEEAANLGLIEPVKGRDNEYIFNGLTRQFDEGDRISFTLKEMKGPRGWK